MAKRGKKYLTSKAKVEPNKKYPLAEALKLIKDLSYAKFDETVDLAVRLGVDPRKSDQMVRGSVTLPHGTGKKMRILVLAKGEKQQEAKEAGADYVGDNDLVTKIIEEKWLDFDKVIATPDMMGVVGKLGKILGPRGLMPNPKMGTVTFDIAKTVKELKTGKVEYKVDKMGNVHTIVGKLSFGAEKLKENLMAILENIVKARPASSKGTYILNIAMSTTMGPGIKLDPQELINLLK